MNASCTQCIDECSLDAGPSGQRLKLLQDVCTLSGALPPVYRMAEVSLGSRIGGGAEATVYSAKHHGSAVVVRQFHPPPHNDWDGDEGQAVLKVSSFQHLIYVRCAAPKIFIIAAVLPSS